MASVSDHLNKVREERIAREKARIDKLRELNLKKYGKTETPQPSKASNVSSLKTDLRKSLFVPNTSLHPENTKRPITAPPVIASDQNSKTSVTVSSKSSNNKLAIKTEKQQLKRSEVRPWNFNVPAKAKPFENGVKSIGDTSKIEKKSTSVDIFKKPSGVVKSNPSINRNLNTAVPNKAEALKTESRLPRKSFIPKIESKADINIKNKPKDRPSVQPTTSKSTSEVNPNRRQSVFERLYQPKSRLQRTNITDSEKLKNDPSFLKKVVLNSALILNKRHSVFEPKQTTKSLPRRSISAVHFRRMSKGDLGNCIHKWSSIGEKLDKVHLKEMNEDASVKEDKIVSAVKSERKRVKFQTPIYNFNTPKPEELQSRLQSWLQNRGKSIDSYHHLQCFGMHHLARKEIKPLNLETSKFEQFDDEDKENKPVESDSDNESYHDNLNNKEDNDIIQEMLKSSEEKKAVDNKDLLNVVTKDRWRRVSCMSDCATDLNESQDSMVTSLDTPHVENLLLGALNDLTELLKEGFDWEQCARWLRAIRERFPAAPSTAAYWECRAALEERRGDLPASVQCWEEAIAKGTERSVVEANLDQLLDKFMQLRISPGSGKPRCPDPKLVDVKNVFKSTLIRFAVQQARLRQSQEPTFTVTPVRRSGRLSVHRTGRTPLQDCTSVHQASLLLSQPHPLVFQPNDKLADTP